MVCPNDLTQMVNYKKDGEGEIIPLKSGGIAEDEVYETWYEYICPECGRMVKETYRCEVLSKNGSYIIKI